MVCFGGLFDVILGSVLMSFWGLFWGRFGVCFGVVLGSVLGVFLMSFWRAILNPHFECKGVCTSSARVSALVVRGCLH